MTSTSGSALEEILADRELFQSHFRLYHGEGPFGSDESDLDGLSDFDTDGIEPKTTWAGRASWAPTSACLEIELLGESTGSNVRAFTPAICFTEPLSCSAILHIGTLTSAICWV